MDIEYLFFSRKKVITESNSVAEKIRVKIAENIESQNHNIADWLRLEDTSRGHLV